VVDRFDRETDHTRKHLDPTVVYFDALDGAALREPRRLDESLRHSRDSRRSGGMSGNYVQGVVASRESQGGSDPGVIPRAVSSGRGMSVRVAFLSFLPDYGHVAPLVRLAGFLADRGFETTLYIPEESAPLARQLDVRHESLGRFLNAKARKARRTFTYRPFRGRLDEGDLSAYWDEIELRSEDVFAGLLERLSDFGPALIVADGHVFEQTYARLARSLGVPLVLNHSNGTRLVCETANAFPLTEAWFRSGDWPYRARHRLGSATAYMRRLARQARDAFPGSRSRRVQALVGERRRAFQAGAHDSGSLEKKPEPRIHHIAMGLGVLQAAPSATDSGSAAKRVEFFPQFIPAGRTPVPSSLAEWLRQMQGKRIFYVSLGTMIPVNRRLIGYFREALSQIDNGAFLWQVSDAGIAKSMSEDLPSEIFFVDRFPHFECLALESVMGCICHGGSGTLFESLWAGKPVACIPILWDQFYNAGLIDQLKAGFPIDPNRLSARELASACTRLLDQPAFAERAREYSGVLSDSHRQETIVNFIANLQASPAVRAMY
jgi:UDP:flavonoid glycosyltransferase YjiC (YdhE family)